MINPDQKLASVDSELYHEVRALRIREAQLTLILEGVQDHAISMLDPSGAILTWNATAERIKGYTLDEVRGKHFRLLFTEEDRRAGIPEEELVIARTKGKFQGEGYRRRKDGSLFFANVSVSALRDDRGVLQGFVKVTHDITERLRAQRRMEILNQSSLALATTLDESSMLSRFVRTLADRFVNLASIEFINEQGLAWHDVAACSSSEAEAHILAHRGLNPPDFTRHPLSSLLTGIPYVVLDSVDTQFDGDWRPSPCERCTVVVPVVMRGRLFGALVLARASEGFDEGDLQLAEDLSRRLSLSIECARLFERARQGEDRLALALEAGEMGAWEWDTATNRVTWSTTLEDIHGIPRGSFAGTMDAFHTDMHPDDRERVLTAISTTLDTRQPYHVVYRIIRAGGQIRWLEARAILVRDADSHLRLVGVCSDITARKRAQDELSESERRFRAVFDNALDAMLITDDQQEVVDVNPAACELVRTTREGLVGQKIDLLLVDTPDVVSGRPNECHRDGSLRGETRVRCADNTIVEIEYAATANVVPGRHFAVWREVGSRRRAENMLAFLAEASTILSSSLDYKTAISSITRLAVPMLADWACADLVDSAGTICRLSVAHVDPTRVELAHELNRRWPAKLDDRSGIAAVIRTGEPEIFTEIPDLLLTETVQDPELLHIIRALGFRSSMCVPLIVRGRAIGALTFVSAESGRRFGPDNLVHAQELARRASIAIDNAWLYESEQNARRRADFANRAKDDFLATVSHELRTPLNAMLGWARILRLGQVSDEKKQHALEVIERNALTQAQLIEDLLDVSRIIAGKLRLNVRSLDLASLVRETVDTFRPASEAKALSLAVSLDPSVGPIAGDTVRLQQVIGNLLSNATKFTPAGGSIQVQLTKSNSGLCLVVRDSGCGIAPEFLSQVFERFAQADAHAVRAQSGLGLGLAISRHIVELHGGRIEIESAGLGKGTAVTVFLPASVAPQESGIDSSKQADGPELGTRSELTGLKVLVVDDEQDGREWVAAVLARAGAVVCTAQSAHDALALLEQEKPNVMIADIGLPDADGYELIRKVRALPSTEGANIPAAALTAYARAEDRRKALDAGYMMHVAKPAEPAELIDVVLSLSRFETMR